MNGYSGQVSRNMRDFPWKLENFPNELSIKTLNSIAGISHILIHSKLIKNFNLQDFLEKIQNTPQLKLIKKDLENNLLLEFKPEFILRNNFHLQAPSYPHHQKLNFQLKSKSVSQDKLNLPLFLKKHAKTKPFTTLELEQDGNWHEFQITLPETPDTVRPLQIRFEIGSSLIFLRNSQVIN